MKPYGLTQYDRSPRPWRRCRKKLMSPIGARKARRSERHRVRVELQREARA